MQDVKKSSMKYVLLPCDKISLLPFETIFSQSKESAHQINAFAALGGTLSRCSRRSASGKSHRNVLRCNELSQLVAGSNSCRALRNFSHGIKISMPIASKTRKTRPQNGDFDEVPLEVLGWSRTPGNQPTLPRRAVFSCALLRSLTRISR